MVLFERILNIKILKHTLKHCKLCKGTDILRFEQKKERKLELPLCKDLHPCKTNKSNNNNNNNAHNNNHKTKPNLINVSFIFIVTFIV